MKKYTIEVTIYEGNDHFWNEILTDGRTGCDDVLDCVKSLIQQDGFDDENTEVKLIGYTDQ